MTHPDFDQAVAEIHRRHLAARLLVGALLFVAGGFCLGLAVGVAVLT